jgi:hypothetical protein
MKYLPFFNDFCNDGLRRTEAFALDKDFISEQLSPLSLSS